jgi:hypothetical protein
MADAINIWRIGRDANEIKIIFWLNEFNFLFFSIMVQCLSLVDAINVLVNVPA